MSAAITRARAVEIAHDAAWNLRLAAQFLLQCESRRGYGEAWTMIADDARKALDALGEPDAMIGDLTPHICKDAGPGAAQGLCWYCCSRIGPRAVVLEAGHV